MTDFHVGMFIGAVCALLGVALGIVIVLVVTMGQWRR